MDYTGGKAELLYAEFGYGCGHIRYGHGTGQDYDAKILVTKVARVAIESPG